MIHYRSMSPHELAERAAWIERLRTAIADTCGQADGCGQGSTSRQMLEAIQFIYYEGEPVDDLVLRKGGLLALGDVFVEEWGAKWCVREEGDRRDYVLDHEAFPEPVIMRRLHEYCDTAEYEALSKDGEPVVLTADGKEIWVSGVLEWAYDALLGRIQAHQRGFRVFWDKREWTKNVPFSIGVDSFPPL